MGELGVHGVRVGHWTDPVAETGCTVVLLPEGTVASGEVRGGAPATRETALLDPGRLVDRIDAVVLTGGSAFGLASADGVVRWCEAQGRGYRTDWGRIPIVVALGLFDLATGDATVRPGPEEGVAACETAGPDFPTGRVGAGTGATVDKWRGPEHRRPGGLGAATRRAGDVVVGAVVAVNAVGDLPGRTARHLDAVLDAGLPGFGSTTIGVVVTNAALDKTACHLAAQSGHDGMARALLPAHTAGDGDALVVAATGTTAAHTEPVRLLAALAVEDAIRDALG